MLMLMIHFSLQETEGVGVYTYGPTTEFPSFFTRDSGCHSPYNIQTPLDAAKIIGIFSVIKVTLVNSASLYLYSQIFMASYI